MRPLVVVSSAVLVFVSAASERMHLVRSEKPMHRLRRRHLIDNVKQVDESLPSRRTTEDLDEDDRNYWESMLRQDGFSLPPTPAPVLVPTPRPPSLLPPTPRQPTPSPIILPTESPVTPPTDSPILITPSPTPQPVIDPTPLPSEPPTLMPVLPPMAQPTPLPTVSPTVFPISPTLQPVVGPTPAPVDPTTAPVDPTPVPTEPPTISPTEAPTASPTVSPTAMPTSSPTKAPSSSPSDFGTCNLMAAANCVTIPDRLPCSTLLRVPEDEVTCSAPPTELGWAYFGTNCEMTDDNRAGFMCQDSNGGPESSLVVYGTATGSNNGQEYFSGLLFRMMNGLPNSAFVMSSGDSEIVLDSSVDVVFRRSNSDGEVLQTMTIPTSCASNVDSLSIGKMFGATRFDSYRTDETGLVRGSQQVQWEYSVLNDGNVDVELTSVMTNTTGDVVDLMPTDPVTLMPGEDFSVPVEKTITLVESGAYTGTVNFTALSLSGGGGECIDTALSAFIIT